MLDSERNVIGDGEMRSKGQLLVDHADTGDSTVSGRSREVGLAVEQHFTAVTLVNAREHLHQRALAGAILADYRVYFTGVHLKIHACQRGDRSE
jgi:hypothetical protein